MNAPAQLPPAIRTTCPYCGVGCGVLAKPDGRGGAMIAGDPDHPANLGRLCSKGIALGDTLGLEGRLLYPMVRRGDDTLAQIDWSGALDYVAGNLLHIIARDGPDAVAFYLSGQLLTEDYYVANKLMKGFIGSANVDTNSRLCMASSVAGHRRAFGTDTVPGIYEDLDIADLIVLVGSNTAWCHPILFQRMMRNKETRGCKIVVIDPRRTATADGVDLFLPIAPGTDTALFSGLLAHLVNNDTLDRDYIDAHTTGFAEAITRARQIAPDIAATAAATGLAEADVAEFFAHFCTTVRTVTCFSQGVNQSAQGTDKVNAIINCHLATGRIGKPGAGPFSLTGQPNAMGGREVGGLANQLAAHMGFSRTEIDRVRRFWRAPRMAQREGLKAVQMFEAIEAGRIKALWVMATNPAVSLPRAGAMAEALRKLELFVVSENVMSNDTVNAGAHALLPAAAWGEKDGTVTNSERRISRQRSFLPLPGEAKPDWWIVTEVARRMGFAEAFSYQSVTDIFREHARLSTFENDGARDFDLGAFVDISGTAFETLNPVQWPARDVQPCETRFFAQGGFFTPDQKARFIASDNPALKDAVTESFPYRLNTGRARDQWHTMTRTGLSPRLGAHMPEPLVEIHPADAEAAGLDDGGFAKITTRYASCVLKVSINDGQRRGSLFAPIHWSNETSSAARIGDLVAPYIDPISGQPEAKATAASIAPVDFAMRGFALTRHPIKLPGNSWWARTAVTGGFGYLFATAETSTFWHEVAPQLFGPGAELAEYSDPSRDVYRVAAFVDGRLDGCIFVGPAAAAPQWDAVKALFEMETIETSGRQALLAGRAADGIVPAGPVVCVCFGVALATIREAIATQALVSVDDIGKALRAGTNCGSCVPELKRLLLQRTGDNERIANAV
ncbi:MAG: molybdopterin-dependent oxidoreductase [Rhizobiales bacterium]|nr:molybdopterin-dependent oxidoreductase [Hyphomicrobiales bacterium]